MPSQSKTRQLSLSGEPDDRLGVNAEIRCCLRRREEWLKLLCLHCVPCPRSLQAQVRRTYPFKVRGRDLRFAAPSAECVFTLAG